MARRHYKDWLKAYCDLLDGKTEAPRRFLFWSAVSTIAGALTRRVVIDENTFRYYPNFYILLVSPPGAVKKTSTIDLAISLLRDLAEEVDHIVLGPDITTVEGLCNYIATLNRDVITKASHTGIPSIDDQRNNQCACTLSIGEFGTLYNSDDKALVNLLTDMFDCRSVPLWKHTKTQGDDIISNPFLNLVAGTTPQFLQDEFRAQYGGWGLSSRIIFIFADQKERAIYRPSQVLGDDYEENRNLLYEDLRGISQLAGEFKFSPEADAWAEQWYIATTRETGEYIKQDGYNQWIAYFRDRKQVHVHKLAMILSAARRDTLILELDDLRDAVRYIDEVERELPHVFEHKLTASNAALTEQAITERVLEMLANGPMMRHIVMQSIMKYVDSTTANRMIESAVARKVISHEVKSGGASWLKNGHM